MKADPRRRYTLVTLFKGGWPFREIAESYGGTESGVRSTVRKMIERGELEPRRRPTTHWKRLV